MTTKELLKQYRFKMDRVDEALEEYERYKTRAEKMTSVISDVPSRTNKTSDKVGDNSSIMADLSKEYEQRWIEAEKERLALIDSINAIGEPYRTILQMRFVKNMPLEAVATELNYSYIHTARLQGTALTLFEKKYNDDTK